MFAFFVLTQGCEPKKSSFTPLQNGFGVMAQWVGIDSGPGAELYFKDKDSKPILIWPYFGPSSGEILITNDMAFFVADMPDKQGRVGSGAYFAVQAPGPVLDISEDLLKLWAESNHLDFAKVRNHYSPLREKAVESGIFVDYLGGDEKVPATQATFVISWEQVSNIIQDVKRTGKQHVIDNPVLKLHVVYLKKDYGSTNDTK
jgi:hypothetical protein